MLTQSARTHNSGIYSVSFFDGESTTPIFVYIGATTDLKNRQKDHKKHGRNKNNELSQLLKDFPEDNIVYDIVLPLPNYTPEHIFTFYETHFIKEFHEQGLPLLNKKLDGGRGRYPRKRVAQYEAIMHEDGNIEQGKFIAEYPSMNDAARMLGIWQGGISMCALGKSNHYLGFIFRIV
jgi:hypothetical protein